MNYDPFQQEAVNYINRGFSVIVSAPTGAGKTAIAEHVINECLETGQGVIYTAPIKALSNQKFRDFQKQYSDKTGILTGDVSINPDALLLIMTTEIFRNKVLEEPESLAEKRWIIYDEIHYIDDYERGTVWEESLMFLPEHMRLLGLSATIPNIQELAEWISSVHKEPVKTVIEKKPSGAAALFLPVPGTGNRFFKIFKETLRKSAGHRSFLKGETLFLPGPPRKAQQIETIAR